MAQHEQFVYIKLLTHDPFPVSANTTDFVLPRMLVNILLQAQINLDIEMH